ncbi:MAG: cob(I)yrinic acid a,c-diamide adenosyltransferase [Chloroflexi bacterium]|nr:cob(I)yrinic acid a,c-diamide adenosyltransferase [Chloroflexota bacterium]
MKIYTRTGDQGETSLFAGGRVHKDDVRLHAYGTIDELNSILGMVRAGAIDPGLDHLLSRVQMELFHVGADLATPLEADAKWVARVDQAMIDQLETDINTLDEELSPLKNFIVPGGTPAAATLHFARTVARRAERWLVALSQQAEINAFLGPYVNRLTDWLFVLARAANARADVPDVPWTSPRSNSE